MIKIKHLFIFILCLCLLNCSFRVTSAENVELPRTTIYLTGNGIAARLHKPVLEEFSNINIEFIRVLQELSEESNPVRPSDNWLFLGTSVYKHK